MSRPRYESCLEKKFFSGGWMTRTAGLGSASPTEMAVEPQARNTTVSARSRREAMTDSFHGHQPASAALSTGSTRSTSPLLTTFSLLFPKWTPPAANPPFALNQGLSTLNYSKCPRFPAHLSPQSPRFVPANFSVNTGLSPCPRSFHLYVRARTHARPSLFW